MKNLFTKSNYVFKSFISILFCSYSLERQSNQNCSLYLRNKSRALVVARAGLGRGGGGLVTSGLMYPCWSWWCLLSSVGALLTLTTALQYPAQCGAHLTKTISKYNRGWSLLTAGMWCVTCSAWQSHDNVTTRSMSLLSAARITGVAGNLDNIYTQTICCLQPLFISAANRLIGEVVQSRRRPLLGPSPGWKRLLALSHLRHY